MINHLRTLLANIDAAANDLTLPGAELVDANYRAVRLPGFLQALRATLFSPKPDQLLLNYRLRQITTLLHATELEEFVLELDPRITYTKNGRTDLFDTAFGVTVELRDETTNELHVLGEPDSPERSGRCRQSWLVTVEEGQVDITYETNQLTTQVEYTISSNGRSNLLQLPGSDLWFRITGDVGDSWYVTASARPVRDLGEIVVALQGIGEDVLAPLFGSASASGQREPWATFANLWYRHPELPYQLGGLVLAMAYRTEQVRLTGAIHD